jgi:hypothetical protein
MLTSGGDGAAALHALADYYEKRTGERWAELMQSKAA